MDRTEFSERLKRAPLLCDGAFGTVLHDRGVAFEQCFDALNLQNPALVASLHGDYIDAGADIIETNTFGANRFRLSPFALQDKVGEINAAAVDVARRAIAGRFRNVLLAGSVGPLGVRLSPLGRVSAAAAEAAFREQIAALLDPSPYGYDVPGVDLIILETFSDLYELKAAIAAARSLSTTIPVTAQMTFAPDDRTLLGSSAADMARTVAELDVDAIGVNCSGGPAQVLRLMRRISQVAADKVLIASPNAGWPEQSADGRMHYTATEAYFADYARAFREAGIALIGGCCGTTPSHIAAMRVALDQPGESSVMLPEVGPTGTAQPNLETVDPPTELAQSLAAGRFVVTVEMRPPKGIGIQRMLAGATMLKAAGATMLNIADNPLARMRMSAWAAAYLMQQQIGLEAVLHFPTRGRNLLRLQGDLLAAHALGVRNLFVVMGDPTKIGDYPDAMDSYDLVPSGLIQLIKQRLNQGVDQAGRPLDQPTNFTVGCALSLEASNPDEQIKQLARKIKAGADFALTQPVFNPEIALPFIARCRQEFGAAMPPVIIGVQPLFNSKNAEFLHNEVPGIQISEARRQRLRQAAEPQAEGVLIARELVLAMREQVQGIYFVPAFGRYDLVANVMDVLAPEAVS
ncbi:MAG: bifunctional homocysteine S-methyltransferase/methylenetetrahydrofolate reductase [Ardenticatenales bacterium]|nr:bifunctional homocysteine S-methyltransferase/methylenetetrahydrofolate reductase [Ardenticatenales bacterium]